MKIAGVVLAAGGSTRLGSAKQLLQFRGRSFLAHAVETAQQANLDPLIVVLGANAERLRAEVAPLGVTVVENTAWQEGMGSSLRAGIAALDDPVDAALVMLCDQPLIDAAALLSLAGAFAAAGSEEAIAASGYSGGLGVPAVFGCAHFAELMAMEGDQGARRLLRANADRVITVSLPAAVTDIDTPGQYANLQTNCSDAEAPGGISIGPCERSACENRSPPPISALRWRPE